MAVIALTSRTSGVFTIAKTTLSASDTLAYAAGTGQLMELTNSTGGALTATLVGAGASATYAVAGTAGTTINASAGKAIQVAAGATVGILLDNLPAYLVGAVTVTGGTGLVASVLGN